MARRWLIAGAAVLVVVVGAGVAVGLSFDPTSQKDRIVLAVRRATGRELTLAGPIRVEWGVAPVLEAEDVSLANVPGGTRPQMAAVARVEARMKLLPLLSGRVEIANVTLVRPDILLETDANGRGNWQFDRPVVASGPTTSSPGPRMTTQLDSLRIESGRLTWHNGVTGQTIAADVPDATFDLGDGPAHLLAQAQAEGTDVKLNATLGTWAQLTAAVPKPWPVKLEASAGNATVALDGTADPAMRRFSGWVHVAAPDLASLGTLLGQPHWPPLHDVHFAGTLLPTGGLPQDVSFTVGQSDLGSFVPGAMLSQASLNWPAGQPARLQAAGTVDGGPWRIATGLLQAGQGVALRGLAFSSPFGDAAGDLAVTAGPRPALRGTVVANRVDGDAIRQAMRSPTRPQPSFAPAGAATPVQPVPPPASPLFSTTPLPWGSLHQADADLQLTIGTLHLGGADYRNATGHLAMQDGLAQLNPASVQSPEGRVDLSGSADGRGDTKAVALVVRSAAMSLDAILQAAGLPGGSDATAEVDVVLHANGDSPHALASTLGGHVGIAMVDGEVSNAALAAALGDVLRQPGAGFDPNGRSHVRCLAIRADAVNGQVTLTALKLDTPRLELDGSGTVNLADETLAVQLRPLLRLGGAGVAAPLRVSGPLRRPVVALDQAPGSGRTSVVIGGLAGPTASCTPELTAARDGHGGRLPAEAASSKLPKAADLLRSFLR